MISLRKVGLSKLQSASYYRAERGTGWHSPMEDKRGEGGTTYLRNLGNFALK